MPPKKTAAAKAKPPATAGPQHASYQDMVKEAIVNLKERNGSSRQAIKKYIQANNNLGSTTDASFTSHISKALKSGEENGVFERPKGASGPVKLKKPAAKAAAPAKPAVPATKPKAAEKKAAATPGKAATKKATPKKAAAAKPAAKKAALPTPKANAGRPRTKQTAAPIRKPRTKQTSAPVGRPRTKQTAKGPAVVEKPAVVLGKTKSGRVTKLTAPQPKKATPKKTATPKKATPKKA